MSWPCHRAAWRLARESPEHAMALPPCLAPSHAMRLLMRPCGCLSKPSCGCPSKLAEDELDEAEIPGFDSAALVRPFPSPAFAAVHRGAAGMHGWRGMLVTWLGRPCMPCHAMHVAPHDTPVSCHAQPAALLHAARLLINPVPHTKPADALLRQHSARPVLASHGHRRPAHRLQHAAAGGAVGGGGGGACHSCGSQPDSGGPEGWTMPFAAAVSTGPLEL